MKLFIVAYFLVYAVVGIGTLLAWWALYERLLSRGYHVRDAVFGQKNPAVAMDLLGGLMAIGLLIYSVVRSSPHNSIAEDLLAIVLSLAVMLGLLVSMRILLALLLRAWFGLKRDAQGDVVSFNNEIFVQRNLATGVFSTVVYLILAAGLAEQNLVYGLRFWDAQLVNMLGVWLLGALVVVLHSFFYLGYGFRNHILHECFHDNNPAAAFSLLGLVGGMLLLNRALLELFKPADHMFNSLELWAFILLTLVIVLLARLLMQAGLYALFRINLRRELVISDNVAWGMLDGGLIFILCLILLALVA